MSAEEDIRTVARGLRKKDRELLMKIAHLLKNANKGGTVARRKPDWDRIAASFSRKAVREMKRAINEGCEQIDEDKW